MLLDVCNSDCARIVGHLPTFGWPLSYSSPREKKVNRGAGYGVELPCKYRLYGPKLYMDKRQEIIVSLRSKCLSFLSFFNGFTVLYTQGGTMTVNKKKAVLKDG